MRNLARAEKKQFLASFNPKFCLEKKIAFRLESHGNENVIEVTNSQEKDSNTLLTFTSEFEFSRAVPLTSSDASYDRVFKRFFDFDEFLN